MAKCKKTISRKNLRKLAKDLVLTAQELDKIVGGELIIDIKPGAPGYRS